MSSPYDLIRITASDLAMFEKSPSKSKIGIILDLVLSELPQCLKTPAKFSDPCLEPIEGFEDENVKGYEVVVRTQEEIEKFIRGFVPFFILKK